MMVLAASSAAAAARALPGSRWAEIGPVAGAATTIAILYIIIIALAGLRNRRGQSPGGVKKSP